MVIASGGWLQNASDTNQEKSMSATGILICHDNSYPFQERTLSLEQPVKIGRSVARARAANDNAIFDCKVLSRNHALLWYDCGKFYLKDTKSSNGTFVNNKRLSPSGEESVTCEVSSGDVVQFGVDVVESTKKVTHGCIVATLKLYLPDGKEAKANLANSVAYVNVTLEDLYKLNQFIQEAGRRELALRSKLEYMQQLLEHTRLSANQSWKALILEDCLLSRLEMLENQVLAYSKNFGEDKLRIELINLLEDKAQYQNATKELLQKKVQEKKEIIGKIQILKCRLSETVEETQSLHNIIKENQNELQELAIKYIKLQQTLQETSEKLNRVKSKLKEVTQQSEQDKQDLMKKLEDQKSIERNLQVSLRDSKLNTVHIYKQISALKNYIQTLQDIKYITNQSIDSKDDVNPIDAINIILSKWNSMYVEISDNEIQIDEDDYQEQQINSVYSDLKFKKSFCIDNNHFKNDLIMNSSTMENNGNKFILPPVTNKSLLTNKLDARNFKSDLKNKFCIANTENNLSFVIDNEICDWKINDKALISKIQDNMNANKKENIASINLIMRFDTNKIESFNKRFFNKNNNQSEIQYVDPKNLLSNPLSTHIITIAQQINNMIEINQNLLLKQNESKIEQVYSHNDFVIDTLKPSTKNNFIISRISQEFLLRNMIHLSACLRKSNGDENYKITIQELQELQKWLFCTPNEIIINEFQKYYHQFQNETLHVQELSEQLVILKEKYNITVEEKANVIRKLMNLEAQCKNFINTNYMVPIYYVIPIIFTLIWMILEKIL